MSLRHSLIARAVAVGAALGLMGCTAGSSLGNDADGGDGGDTTGNGDGGAPAGACGVKTASLSGTLDGTTVNQSYSSTGFSLVTKTFSGSVGTRGRVEITLATSGASSAGTAIATAKLTMPNEGPFPGKVFCATGGKLTSGDTYTFTLTGLSASDGTGDAGTCSGSPVAGELDGCIGRGK